MQYSLRMTGTQHLLLRSHLFPGDNKEAVALCICGRRNGSSRHVFTCNKIVPIPYDRCTREVDKVTWPTEFVDEVIAGCYSTSQAIVKVHSHPSGYPKFSEADDTSDREIFSSVSSLLDDGLPHASLVMLPDGSMFGRTFLEGHCCGRISPVQIVGDEIKFFGFETGAVGAFAERHAQAFGRGTVELLSRLSIAVVGCSGTGSFVVELLSRLGVGRLVLIDPDVVEERNLNRILNAGKQDAYLRRPKVHVLARAIAHMGLGQEVVPLQSNLATREAIFTVADCDAVFGCMDGVEGRHWLNRIATFYNLPYIDVGVRLDADGRGGIDSIAGAVHYLQPGLSSLLSRGTYSMDRVESEELRRVDPDEHARRVDEGYLRGVDEDRPAVISVNAFFASQAVNEFLARIHEFRNLPNCEYAVVRGSLSEVQLYREPEIGECPTLRRHVGRGDVVPLLDRPLLS